MLLSVKWESHVVGSDRDHSLSTIKSVVFVKLDLLLPALIKLLLEALLVVDHIDNTLIDIPTVTGAAPESAVIRCLPFVDQSAFAYTARKAPRNHAVS